MAGHDRGSAGGSRVALVGLGTVGCGWAAAYLAKGFEVIASDPAGDAEQKCHDFLRRAWPAMRRLTATDLEHPPFERLVFASRIADTVADCSIVHESVPENLEFKRRIYADIEAAGPADAIIASSTGGIPPSQLQAEMTRPQRLVVVHPFNPPHILPLVEVLGGGATDRAVVDRAIALMRQLGKHPIRIDREAPGFLANRLQFALLREAVNCLAEGIASAEAIEDAVRFGLGPRWAVMGSLTTLALSGGTDGMAAVMERFGPAIEGWWSALGSPTLTPEVRAKLIAGAEEIADGRTMSEWAAWRDDKLAAVLEACGHEGKA